jgi:hypothetical protein
VFTTCTEFAIPINRSDSRAEARNLAAGVARVTRATLEKEGMSALPREGRQFNSVGFLKRPSEAEELWDARRARSATALNCLLSGHNEPYRRRCMAMSVAPRIKEQLGVRAEHPSLTSPVCTVDQPYTRGERSRLADTFPPRVAKKLHATPRTNWNCNIGDSRRQQNSLPRHK